MCFCPSFYNDNCFNILPSSRPVGHWGQKSPALSLADMMSSRGDEWLLMSGAVWGPWHLVFSRPNGFILFPRVWPALARDSVALAPAQLTKPAIFGSGHQLGQQLTPTVTRDRARVTEEYTRSVYLFISREKRLSTGVGCWIWTGGWSLDLSSFLWQMRWRSLSVLQLPTVLLESEASHLLQRPETSRAPHKQSQIPNVILVHDIRLHS